MAKRFKKVTRWVDKEDGTILRFDYFIFNSDSPYGYVVKNWIGCLVYLIMIPFLFPILRFYLRKEIYYEEIKSSSKSSKEKKK